ncbi:MAG: protein O-mannosyl-transferase family, partial [Planctomycetota bacterium]
MREITKQDETIIPNNTVVWYLAVLMGAAALYVLTCAPSVLWQDSGVYVYRIWHNDIQGDLGLALSHPLYIMVGIAVKHIPLGELAWRINLISALFGAVAIANLFLLLRLWLGKNLPAI